MNKYMLPRKEVTGRSTHAIVAVGTDLDDVKSLMGEIGSAVMGSREMFSKNKETADLVCQ